MLITLKRDGTTRLRFEGQPLASTARDGLFARRLTLYRTEDGRYVIQIEVRTRSGAALSDAFEAESALQVYYLIATETGGFDELNHRELLRDAAQLDPPLARVTAELLPEVLAGPGCF